MPARLRSPATDFAYQTTGADFGIAPNSIQHPVTPFRLLSQDFLTAEMKRDYRKEAFCFLIIAGLAAWPIASMVNALSLLK
ncbi:MAG TPA: hypothetical protein VIU85_08510 [Chthoniobacterales bacterium]